MEQTAMVIVKCKENTRQPNGLPFSKRLFWREVYVEHMELRMANDRT